MVHMIFRCFLSLASGLVAGFVFLWLAIVAISPIMIILISVSITLVVGFSLRITSVHEYLRW
jgi:hypothetical protein